MQTSDHSACTDGLQPIVLQYPAPAFALAARVGLPHPRRNRFTAHAMKDIFNCRFYVGVVTHKGTEYPGQHEAIISEELFQAV